MATHYSETILADVKAALETIIESDGYNNTLLKVERLDRTRAVDSRPPFARIRRSAGAVSQGDGIREWDAAISVEIELVLRQDTDSSERTDELEGEWLVDVLIALGAKFHVADKPQLIGVTWEALSDEPDEKDDGLRFTATFAYQEDMTTLAYTGP